MFRTRVDQKIRRDLWRDDRGDVPGWVSLKITYDTEVVKSRDLVQSPKNQR